MKPMLKPPGAKHLKLNCDVLLSTFALKFKLRRYIVGALKDPDLPVKVGQYRLTLSNPS
jgi:hypothetical protein